MFFQGRVGQCLFFLLFGVRAGGGGWGTEAGMGRGGGGNLFSCAVKCPPSSRGAPHGVGVAILKARMGTFDVLRP